MSNFSNDLPIGAMLPTLASYNTPNIIKLSQKGYLFCDGSLNGISDDLNLSSAIGTNWGGVINDGKVVKLNLPPFCGTARNKIFLRGVDPTGIHDHEVYQRTPIATGGATGTEVGSYQNMATASPTSGNHFTTESGGVHKHSYNSIGSPHSHYRGTNAHDELENAYPLNISEDGKHTHLLGAGHGSGGNKETAPVSVSLNWIIKQAEL